VEEIVENRHILACRCMEVTEDEIRNAVRQGARTVDAVKRVTQACFGLCQSKTCYNIIARIISEETGIPASEIYPIRIRIPVRPLNMDKLDK
jgi:NAD(P)H-nitrite reductase large subunit